MAQTTSDIANGAYLKFKGDIVVVVEFQHVNPGKGSAFVRARLKSLTSGKVVEQTWKAGEVLEFVDVQKRKMQYLYSDPTGFTFMDQDTFDQVTVNRSVLEDRAGFLKEGLEVHVVLHEGTPISVELPKKVSLKVTEAFSAVRGDTAGGNLTKEVTVETGVQVKVPMFIKEGESVVMNTDTGEYVERG
ncbi:elongation factor P [Candidatus Uhrbacteria bacterium]|nr:elongation factor P [Candidatus Uhrbacteria bacterium]